MHDTGYCWRPECVYPFESLRSLLSKFMLLNKIGVNELNQVIGYNTTSKRNVSLINNRSLLNNNIFDSCIDPAKLKKILGLKDEQLLFSVIDPYTYHGNYCRQEFRFCPSCLEVGYHSPFHQHGMFIRCPIHGDKLINKCVKCSANFSYELTRNATTHPYACKQCGHVHIINDRGVENKLNKQIADISDFLMRRQFRAGIYEKRISCSYSTPTKKSGNYNVLFTNWLRTYEREQQMTPYRWSDVIGRNYEWLSRCSIARPETFKTYEYQCEHNDHGDPSIFQNICDDTKLESYSFKPIYKAIKRHIRKELLKPGRQLCHLKDYYASMRYAQYGETKPNNAGNDVFANAYTKFSGYYNLILGESTPTGSTHKRVASQLIEHFPNIYSFIKQHDLPVAKLHQIINRILADECQSGYLEFVMRSIVHDKHGKAAKNVFERDRRYDSHWLIDTSQPNSIKLHFWVPKLSLHKILIYIQRYSVIA